MVGGILLQKHHARWIVPLAHQHEQHLPHCDYFPLK